MAKEGAHEKLEKVLVKWLLQARSSAINIDGAILKEKADLVALRLGIDGFKASNGWLDRFKKRNNIVYSRSCGESSTRRLAAMERSEEEKISVLDAMHMIASSWSAGIVACARDCLHCCASTAGDSTSLMEENASTVDDDDFERPAPIYNLRRVRGGRRQCCRLQRTVAGRCNRGGIARCRHCDIRRGRRRRCPTPQICRPYVTLPICYGT
ncbi:hypothetical protein HPB49_002736 [Dermacentor silvarum]|uniref:Uncharacterized protein n=1 Tax=Dermacentor silvarum TaxID=543639 RepID=A0ACB8CD60_DERSI|nr:hypothetical protein HPB49_002736 [Dermacentor silvarum]